MCQQRVTKRYRHGQRSAAPPALKGPARSSRSTFGSISGRSSAIRPGPKALGRRPMQPDGGACRLRSPASLGRGARESYPQARRRCRRSQATGLVVALIEAAPSGTATTVSAPFRTMMAPEREAACRARSSFGRRGKVAEQPCELPVMRREHDRGVTRGDGREERPWILGEGGQRIGVEHDRSLGAKRRQDHLLGAIALPLRRGRSGPRSCADRQEGFSARGRRRPHAP